MPNTLKIHHCAKRITPNNLKFVMDLFEELGCEESYWELGAAWAMIEQNGNNIIQFIETDQTPQNVEYKRNSHIAFLSEEPHKDLEAIKQWVNGKKQKIVAGQWNDKELYFDCPDVFIDFVIEIMHKSIIE